MIYLSLSRKINQRKVSLKRLQTNPQKARNTLGSSLYNFISHARLKIIRKSFLILSADPVDNIKFLKRFPEKAYCSNCPSCMVLKTHFLQKAAIIETNLLQSADSIFSQKNIPWFWLVGWKTPALFPSYKENLCASRWLASGYTNRIFNQPTRVFSRTVF